MFSSSLWCSLFWVLGFLGFVLFCLGVVLLFLLCYSPVWPLFAAFGSAFCCSLVAGGAAVLVAQILSIQTRRKK
jgi:hypothetical protein